MGGLTVVLCGGGAGGEQEHFSLLGRKRAEKLDKFLLGIGKSGGRADRRGAAKKIINGHAEIVSYLFELFLRDLLFP